MNRGKDVEGEVGEIIRGIRYGTIQRTISGKEVGKKSDLTHKEVSAEDNRDRRSNKNGNRTMVKDEHNYGRKLKESRRQGRRHRRKRKGRGKKRGRVTEEKTALKIGYANVQGKMGEHREGVWQEWEEVVKKNKWEVVVMVETHWQGGVRGRTLEGFTMFDSQRDPTAKKGGGLAVLVKEGIGAVQWIPVDQG